MKITVTQHIFANVPKEQSPRRRRGFQTLYHSRGLTADDLLLLEERAQYFFDEGAPAKFQFHVLPAARAVVSRLVAVPEPDEYGRKGRYLAHSLILSPDEFGRLAFCPMPLVASHHFVADMAAALAAGDPATGDVPPRVIDVPDVDTWATQALEWARQWPAVDLEALARLGWRAAALKSQRQIVELTGDISAMLQALSVCFLLCPPSRRPALTFDTYTYRNEWIRDWPFWGWGGLGDAPAGGPFAYRVDGAAKRVHGRLPAGDDTPYERWIVQQAIPERLEHLSAYTEDALRLDAILAGAPGDLAAVDPTFGRSFAQLNVPAVAQRLLAHVPAELGSARRQQLQQHVRAQPWRYLTQLARGYTARDAAAELAGVELAMVRGRTPAADAERKALAELAATAGSEELNNLLLLPGKDRNTWRRSLARLPAGSYQPIIEAAISTGVATTAEAFVAEHLATWCAVAARLIRPGELKGVLRAIDGQTPPPDVDVLQQLWPALDEADRRTLIDWLRRYPGPAPALREVLGVSPEDAPAGRSRLGRLRLSFGRKGDESDEQG